MSRAAAARAAQLDEKSYANLVAKRRMETGGFVVGDADGGCARRGVAREGDNSQHPSGPPDAPLTRRSYEDIGEEDDWEAADRDSEPEDGDEAAAEGEPAKKQKGKDGKVRLAQGRPARRRAARHAPRGAAPANRASGARSRLDALLCVAPRRICR